MRGKSIRVAASHHKALIAVVVVMLLASCMANEESKPEDVGTRPRALNALVAAHNVTSMNQSLTSSVDIHNNEERVFIEAGSDIEELRQVLERMAKELPLLKHNPTEARFLNSYEFQKIRANFYANSLEKGTYPEMWNEVLQLDDVVLASIVAKGSSFPETVDLSTHLGYLLMGRWTVEHQTPEGIFRLLKIDEADEAKKLFDGPFTTWVMFVLRRAQLEHDGSRVTRLESRFKELLSERRILAEEGKKMSSLAFLVRFQRVSFGKLRWNIRNSWPKKVNDEAYREMAAVLKKGFSDKPGFLEKAFQQPVASLDESLIPHFKKLSAAYDSIKGR